MMRISDIRSWVECETYALHHLRGACLDSASIRETARCHSSRGQ